MLTRFKSLFRIRNDVYVSIQCDDIGLFVKIDNRIARPVKVTTFKSGDLTEIERFTNSRIIGVGKLSVNDQYLEYWHVYYA